MLICSRREVKRVADLTADEICDLWLTAQKVGGMLECYHKASSLTFTIQVRWLLFTGLISVIILLLYLSC